MIATSGPLLTHGVGLQHDLPVPLFYAIAAGFVALMVSFLSLAVLWPESRLDGVRSGRRLPLDVLDGPRVRWALRIVGLVGTAFVFGAAALGPDDSDVNPAPVFVYVVFWVGLIPLSLLFGPVWKLLNPLRTLHRLAGSPQRRPLPAWLGYWPAAAALFAFTWLELVTEHPASTRNILLFFGAYAAIQLAAACWFGAGWFDRGDGFEVYSSLIGRLSTIGRRDGRLVLRNPMANLDALPPAPGLVAAVCVLLGSTLYDGFSEAGWWSGVLADAVPGRLGTGTLGLLGVILLVAGLYVLCTTLAGGLGGLKDTVNGRRHLPALFVHSLIPIAVGYLVAHYFSLFVFDGQQALVLASDPLGTGLNLFGTASWTVDLAVVSPRAIALVQVSAVVVGHVIGVVAAHDRAVRVLPRDRAISGQLPMLVLMICYTLGGLTLMFAV